MDNGGTTVAVLPSGFNHIMPASNRNLAARIVENGGCLVSEYPPETNPNNAFFARRDALIAALASGVVVMECKEKSVTMHTVDAALSIHRPVACYYLSLLPPDFLGTRNWLKRVYRKE